MDYESKLCRQIQDLPRSGIRDFFELVIGRTDVISLGVGEPDKPTPWPIREAVIRSLEKGQTSYTSNLGLESLRILISEYVTKHFRVTYDPKTEILVTVGVSEALDIAFRAVLNPGDEVIYHEPCYVSYSPSIKMAYGVPVVVQTHEENEFALMAKSTDDRRNQVPAPRLTERELEVLKLVARGLNNRDIAKELFISENTVKNHIRNILEKLQLHSRMEAVVYAVREKLLEIT